MTTKNIEWKIEGAIFKPVKTEIVVEAYVLDTKGKIYAKPPTHTHEATALVNGKYYDHFTISKTNGATIKEIENEIIWKVEERLKKTIDVLIVEEITSSVLTKLNKNFEKLDKKVKQQQKEINALKKANKERWTF